MSPRGIPTERFAAKPTGEFRSPDSARRPRPLYLTSHRDLLPVGVSLRAAIFASCPMTTTADPTTPPVPTLSLPGDGVHDFDFLHGKWRIHNRRLRLPLSGLTEWYDFEATSVERPLWDGQGNLEEYEAVLPTGRLKGLALRLYNPRTRQWAIHWSNSDNGTLDPPMIGDFRNGNGEFYGQEEFQSRAIFLRFIWTSLSSTTCRWEQAFSPDGGRTWETNWIMEFTRVADVLPDR